MVENTIDAIFQKNIVTTCDLQAVSKVANWKTIRTKVTFALAVYFVSSLKVYFMLKYHNVLKEWALQEKLRFIYSYTSTF